ncbi:MAG: hypothetical protein AAF483_11145 [Planctomycetota bacterium]
MVISNLLACVVGIEARDEAGNGMCTRILKNVLIAEEREGWREIDVEVFELEGFDGLGPELAGCGDGDVAGSEAERIDDDIAAAVDGNRADRSVAGNGGVGAVERAAEDGVDIPVSRKLGRAGTSFLPPTALKAVGFLVFETSLMKHLCES